MALPRRSIASWATLLRQRSTTTLRTAYVRQTARQTRARGYASSSSGGTVKKSDIPWFLGAVGVTVPALWYIGVWKPDPNAHHDGEGHEGHDEHKDDNEGHGSESADKEGDSKDKDSSGDGDKGESTPNDAKVDPASPSKEPKSQNQTSGKQEGVANADTKHSTDPANDPGKSDKPEGGPDTSKSKGTVDSTRPQK